MISSRRGVLLTLVLIFALGACAGRAPQPARVESTVTETVQATASPTFTATVKPTQTATPPPTATLTRTPHPSATPRGYEALYGAGFSITLPSDWLLYEKSSSSLAGGDLQDDIVLYVESLMGEDKGGVDAFLEKLRNSDLAGTVIVLGQRSTVSLSGDLQGEKQELMATAGDYQRDVWLISVQQSGHTVNVMLHAPEDGLADNSMTVERLLKSLTVFEPTPFNLPRDETVVLLGGMADNEQLDPAKTTTSANDYVGLLFSGLVRLGPDLSIAPDLASAWRISEDGTVYTFILRENLTFSNGVPITAQMVKDSWERACDPKIESSTAATYLGDIAGVKQRLSGESDQIAEVKVIDERTLEVTLDGPKPYFLAKLTYPTAYVYDVKQAKGNPSKWTNAPVSSGPFTVKSLNADDGVVIFERNPHYWQPAGARYLAFQLYTGRAPLSLFEEGMLDVLSVSGATLNEVGRENHALRDTLQRVPSMCTSMVMLNPNLAPLDDPLVRRALAQSVDRGVLIDKLTGNTGLTASGILPPAMPGAQGGQALPPYDMDAARAALEQSTYAGQELRIRLVTSGYATSQRKDAALLAEQWRQALGIQVTVEYLDPQDYTTNAKRYPGHAVLYGWCADYPDPQNFLDQLFHSTSDFNLTGLADAELDGVLAQARIERDPAARLALYQRAENTLLERGYAIPLFHDVLGVLVSARLQGYVLTSGQAQGLQYVVIRP